VETKNTVCHCTQCCSPSNMAPGLGTLLKKRIFKHVRHEILSAALLKIWLLVYEAVLTGKYTWVLTSDNFDGIHAAVCVVCHT
jgi:hypothetical protein